MTKEQLILESEKALATEFARADEISEYNQEKVLKALQDNGLALRHFNSTTGYGYGDE
ncbi:MAG: methionine gamma-lyase family protein, partial [Clostridia bacterium]|nr:methionine gamma-lyase family protein [Clostridia bacterium]